jgi:lysophospholipase L1-like esterase
MAGRPKAVILGDSHVEGLGPELTRRLPAAGVDVLGVTARRGWSTDAYNRAHDVAQLVLAHGVPDLVVLSLGGNGRPSSKSSYERILRTMVDAVRSAGVRRIVWVGPATALAGAAADAQRRHEQNATWQGQLLPSMGVTWIDSRPMTRTGHAADKVHFTLMAGGGYPTWASALTPAIARAAASPAPAVSSKSGSTSFWVPVAIVGTAVVVMVGAVVLARWHP